MRMPSDIVLTFEILRLFNNELICSYFSLFCTTIAQTSSDDCSLLFSTEVLDLKTVVAFPDEFFFEEFIL